MKTVYIDLEKEMTARRAKKIAKKLYKMNRKEDIVVALSKELENNEELNNQINLYDIKVLDGKWLFKFLIGDIIEYVSNRIGKKEETEVVAIAMEGQDDIVFRSII